MYIKIFSDLCDMDTNSPIYVYLYMFIIIINQAYIFIEI